MADDRGPIPFLPPGSQAPAAVPVAPVHVVDDEEIVDGLPVLSEVRVLEPARVAPIPAVQAAAAAASGFVAGAATMALARRMVGRRLERAFPGGGRPGLLPARGGTRTFLVHIRVLGRPGE
jgi:hypothetical protein